MTVAATVCAGYAQNTPSHAASAQTWTFGGSNLVWSDAVHLPECNKASFENSSTKPQCRSYAGKAGVWYYYNWPYADHYAGKLCPAPWRIPTSIELVELTKATTGSALAKTWGYGGYAYGHDIYRVNALGAYWPFNDYSSGYAYYLYYYNNNFSVGGYIKYAGFQIRCVLRKPTGNHS